MLPGGKTEAQRGQVACPRMKGKFLNLTGVLVGAGFATLGGMEIAEELEDNRPSCVLYRAVSSFCHSQGCRNGEPFPSGASHPTPRAALRKDTASLTFQDKTSIASGVAGTKACFYY